MSRGAPAEGARMRYLLDTHTLAWAVAAPALLGDVARARIENEANDLLISPITIWEMSIKHHLGRWPDVAPFLDDARFRQFVRRLRAEEIAVRIPHARLAGRFDVDHKDPFDRMLAAQALLEGVPILSKDVALERFPVTREW